MKKILLVKLSALGDVIFNIPLANVLKKNGYEVHWLTSEKGIEILKNNPCSDKTFFCPIYSFRKTFNLKYLFEIIRVILAIRREKYDIAFDCQRRLKSLPFMLFSGAKRRIISANAKEFSHLGANEIIPISETLYNGHMVGVNLRYAKYLGLDINNIEFCLPEQSEETKNKVSQFISNLKKPIVVIAPATTWEPKHWNIEHWKKVTDFLKDKCSLVFTGTNTDKDLISQIGGDNFLNLAGKTNISDLMELFHYADLVITPDSGTAHVAWASGHPSIIEIFCCTNPRQFGCFGDDKKYYTVIGNMSCQPCNKRHCRNKKSKNICTQYPNPDEVIKIAEQILEKISAII